MICMAGEPLGRNDTYGYALTAQPDKSQGRPTTNTGSQPQRARTACPYVFPEGHCPGLSHPNMSQAKRNARGPPPHFIPGTNAVESLNYQLRKIIRNRGHFPNDDAVVKLLRLPIRDIEDKRARAREKTAANPHTGASGRLVEGLVGSGWKQALNALDIAYPGQLPEHLK